MNSGWLYASGVWAFTDDKANFDTTGSIRGSCVLPELVKIYA